MAISSQCSVCSRTDTPLSNCARCKTTAYCSKECQSQDWPTHKQDCKRPNYVLKVQIYPDEITDPPVWRTLSVPASPPLRELHRALQIAFNWAGTHSYELHVHDSTYDPAAEATDDTNDLMKIISKTMAMDKAQFDEGGWQGDANKPRKYLARFVDDRQWSHENPQPIDCVHQRSWVHPRTPQKGASQTRLFEVLDKPAYKGQKLTYLYDYGDCWQHDISVVGTAAATGKIKCIDGGGHYVAEDAGCFRGWLEAVDAYKTSSRSQEQGEKRRWFEQLASNRGRDGLGGDGLGRWDQAGINMKLSVLA